MKNIQLENVKHEVEYYKELHKLDLKYQKVYDENNERRKKIYLGEYERIDGSKRTGPSLASLVEGTAPEVNSSLKTDLETTEAKLRVLVESAENGEACDPLIGPDNSEGQEKVRAAIAALVQQTGSIEKAAAALGISDLNPDTADHEF